MIYNSILGNPKCVIICPLDWGLGHASRMIPVVNDFLKTGHHVILGGAGKSGELIHKSFPELLFVRIPCYAVRYPGKRYLLWISLILQLPLLLISAFREHFILNKYIKKHRIDLVVSDNRYGLFSKHTSNIFITHQVSPVLPFILKFAEYPLYLIIRKIINRFDECWIPDFEGHDNLTGSLSHRYALPENSRYVGLLSRFSNESIPENIDKIYYDVVIVLSGPQPELGRFTARITKQASGLSLKILLINGLQDVRLVNTAATGGLHVVSHLPVSEFKNVLMHSGIVICRAGYSSIMDMIVLGISDKTVLIPTPGQSEQEYLAKYLHRKGIFRYTTEPELDLQKLAISIRK